MHLNLQETEQQFIHGYKRLQYKDYKISVFNMNVKVLFLPRPKLAMLISPLYLSVNYTQW
jgi:hypothetical protein